VLWPHVRSRCWYIMGKPGKRRGDGSKQLSAFWYWSIGVAAVSFLAYSAFQQKASRRPRANEAADVDEDDDEGGIGNIFEAVRSTFGGDGKPRFAEEAYWDERYEKMGKKPYDWYATWNTNTGSHVMIKDHIKPHMPSSVASILNIGCGNSRLPEELAHDGYTGIMNIDISKTVIDKMAASFAAVSALTFERMDLLDLSFPDGSYDVVFDKGTLDALYAGAAKSVMVAVAQIFRVLRPGGLFVSMSFGVPSNRGDLNMTTGKSGDSPGWASFQTIEIDRLDGDSKQEKGQPFFMYVMKKP